jgi:CheY-like chemotaxis protein
MAGTEAADQIRQAKDGRNIGIIAVSDKVDPEARQLSISAGYSGYLEKPIEEADIVKAIEPLLPARAA